MLFFGAQTLRAGIAPDEQTSLEQISGTNCVATLVSKEVVRLVFTLRNSDKWSLSRIGARFGKFKQWAGHVLAAYYAAYFLLTT